MIDILTAILWIAGRRSRCWPQSACCECLTCSRGCRHPRRPRRSDLDVCSRRRAQFGDVAGFIRVLSIGAFSSSPLRLRVM